MTGREEMIKLPAPLLLTQVVEVLVAMTLYVPPTAVAGKDATLPGAGAPDGTVQS
jgi:hypothetical protein